MAALKDRLTADMKAAMKARDKQRLGTIRMALAEIKQREVDSRQTLSEADELQIVGRMIKQRRDSAQQYVDGGRDELAAAERAEIEVLEAYLPEALDEAEVDALVAQAIAEAGAGSMQQMGAVMNLLRPRVQGRADMGEVSRKVRERLSG